MVEKLRTVQDGLFVRRCVACGYDGVLLDGGRATECARCGCDLIARPARSYAEMEGLVGHPITIDAPLTHLGAPGPLSRFSRSWLVFLFASIMFLSLVGLLAWAAWP